jgi:hypothetical protein
MQEMQVLKVCLLLLCFYPANHASHCILADEPTVSYVFPAGGQRGTTVRFHVGGHYLHDRCRFQMEGSGVTSVSNLQRTDKTVWFEGPVIPLQESQQKEDYPVDHAGSVTIAADAETGIRRWRVSTSQGVTLSRPFVVGELPEIVEQEIDGDPVPVSVQLPVTINGRIFPREDIDIWTFTLQQGQAVTCTVLAAGLESPLDARLWVTGPDGRILQQSDDFQGTDPRIAFIAPVTGQFQVHLQDANFGGLQDYVYRLSLVSELQADGMYPLGGRRHSTVPFQLYSGQQLLTTKEFLIGGSERTRYQLPEHQLWAAVSDLPEVMEPENDGEAVAAATVELEQVANGRIRKAGELDRWQLSLAAQETVMLDLFAARLGSPLDSVLTVLDPAGKLIAESDDLPNGVTDSQLSFTASEAGNWTVCVADRFADRGGVQFGYRLMIRSAKSDAPGFSLDLPVDAVSLPRGGEAKLKITTVRTGQFQGAIELIPENLPAGVTVEGNLIKAGGNETTLILKASKDAAVSLAPVTIRGRELRDTTDASAAASSEAPEPADSKANALLQATATVRRQRPDDEAGENLWLSVCVPTPFRFVGAFETKYAPRGSTFVRRYRIERGDYKGPLTVSLAERQTRHLQGVTGPVVVVPAEADEFEYPVRLPPWMEIGRTSRTCLMATGFVATEDGQTHPVSYTSFEQNDQVIVLVDPGRMNIRLERDSLLVAAGQAVPLSVQVFQEPGIRGDVRLELVIPAHMRGLKCEPVTVPADSEAGTLTLQFSEAVPGPFNMPLTVRATTGSGVQQHFTEATLTIKAR